MDQGLNPTLDTRFPRWVFEPRVLAGLPIAPNGRWTSDRSGQRVRWAEIGWEVASNLGGALPSSFVLPVYLWLIGRLGPGAEDNAVAFSPNHVLCEIGRGSRPEASSSFAAGGSAYEALATTLRFLADARYSGKGLSSFSILSSYRLPEKAGSAAVVEFTPAFMDLIGRASSFAVVDMHALLALPRGAARSLYRLITSYQGSGSCARLDSLELLQRLGSTQTRTSPSAVRRRLASAHETLVHLGLLEVPPNWTKSGRRWEVGYSLSPRRLAWLRWSQASRSEALRLYADRHQIDDAMSLVVQQALDFGMSNKMALELARERPERFARAVAATAIGLILPKKSLAAMVINYTRADYPIEDRGLRIWGRRPLPTGDLAASAAAYILDSAHQRARRSRQGLPLIRRPFTTRLAVLEVGLSADPAGDPWDLEGIAAMLGNADLELPPFRVADRAA